MKIHLIWVSLSVFLYPLYPVPQTSGNALVTLGFWLGTSGVMAGSPALWRRLRPTCGHDWTGYGRPYMETRILL